MTTTDIVCRYAEIRTGVCEEYFNKFGENRNILENKLQIILADARKNFKELSYDGKMIFGYYWMYEVITEDDFVQCIKGSFGIMIDELNEEDKNFLEILNSINYCKVFEEVLMNNYENTSLVKYYSPKQVIKDDEYKYCYILSYYKYPEDDDDFERDIHSIVHSNIKFIDDCDENMEDLEQLLGLKSGFYMSEFITRIQNELIANGYKNIKEIFNLPSSKDLKVKDLQHFNNEDLYQLYRLDEEYKTFYIDEDDYSREKLMLDEANRRFQAQFKNWGR